MVSAIEDFLAIADKLAVWLKNNPNTQVPSLHKQRLISLLVMALDAKEMTDEEWEALRPRIPEESKHINVYNHEVQLKVIKAEFQAAIKKIKQRAEQQNVIAIRNFERKPDKKVDSPAVRSNDLMIRCDDCKVMLRVERLERHRERCPAKKRTAGKNQHPKKGGLKRRNGGTDFTTSYNPKKEQEQERLLDASKGLHNERRENGRYGSASSFDGMGDEDMA